MDGTFTSEIGDWHDFFTAVAGVSGTLVGLLFVALALNPSIMAGQQRPGVRAWALVTFRSFVTLLVVALIMLIPADSPWGSGIPVLILAGSGLYLLLRDLPRLRQDLDPGWQRGGGARHFISPMIGYTCLLVGSIFIIRDNQDALTWLTSATFFLAIGAAIACLELLGALGSNASGEESTTNSNEA